MLYIIRHGRTDWNDLYKLQGSNDIPLNEVGRAQATKASQEYKDIHFDICYCSPLCRAQETAHILLEERDVPIVTDNRLREMCFGEYEGAQGVFEHPEWPIYKFFKDPENYETVSGAESFDELFTRVKEFLYECVYPQLEEGKDILIVGHGAMNSALVSVVKDIPLKDFWSTGIPNCELIRIK